MNAPDEIMEGWENMELWQQQLISEKYPSPTSSCGVSGLRREAENHPGLLTQQSPLLQWAGQRKWREKQSAGEGLSVACVGGREKCFRSDSPEEVTFNLHIPSTHKETKTENDFLKEVHLNIKPTLNCWDSGGKTTLFQVLTTYFPRQRFRGWPWGNKWPFGAGLIVFLQILIHCFGKRILFECHTLFIQRKIITLPSRSENSIVSRGPKSKAFCEKFLSLITGDFIIILFRSLQC